MILVAIVVVVVVSGSKFVPKIFAPGALGRGGSPGAKPSIGRFTYSKMGVVHVATRGVRVVSPFHR